MRYLLMYWDDDAADTQAQNEDAFLAELRAWVDGMNDKGIRLYGGPLRAAEGAKLLRVRDGATLVSDGPFAETKEQIGGFDILECTDLDEAIEVAGKHPVARIGTLELRPFWLDEDED